MVNFKGCPRCHGDMKTNRDVYGDYNECLQCGYMEDVKQSDHRFSIEEAREPQRRSKRKVA